MRSVSHYYPLTLDITSDDKYGIMAVLGQIGKFNLTEESISVHLEHMELFFATNSTKDIKQVAVLLSVTRPNTHASLYHLLTQLNH